MGPEPGVNFTETNNTTMVSDENAKQTPSFEDSKEEMKTETDPPGSITETKLSGIMSPLDDRQIDGRQGAPNMNFPSVPLENAEAPSSEASEDMSSETSFFSLTLNENLIEPGAEESSSGDLTENINQEISSLTTLELRQPLPEDHESEKIDDGTNQAHATSNEFLRKDADAPGPRLETESEDRANLSPSKETTAGASNFWERNKLAVLTVGFTSICLCATVVVLSLARNWGNSQSISSLMGRTTANLPVGVGKPRDHNINRGQIPSPQAINQPTVDSMLSNLEDPTDSFSQEVILATTPKEVVRLVKNDPLSRPRNVFMLQKWNPGAGLTNQVSQDDTNTERCSP